MERVAGRPNAFDIHVDGQPIEEMSRALQDKHAAEAAQLRAQTRPLQSMEEARAALRFLQENGAETLGQERYDRGLAKVQQFVQDHPDLIKSVQNPQAASQKQPVVEKGDRSFGDSFAYDYFRQVAGLGQVASSMINSAIAEPIAGLAGLGTLGLAALMNDPNPNARAVEQINAWRDALTFVPVGQEGQDMLQHIAGPLMAFEEKAKDISEAASLGNPLAATMIYSEIMVAPDILGFKGGKALSNKSHAADLLNKKVDKAAAVSNRMGVRPTQVNLGSDVVQAARNMSSDVRGANAGKLQQALIEAKAGGRARLDDIKARASQRRAFIDTEQASGFATDFQKRAVEEGFDMQKMPQVQEHLQAIQGLGTLGEAAAATPQMNLGFNAPLKVKARRIQDWLAVRNRIDKTLETTKSKRRIPESTDERALLSRLKNEMDENLQHQFNADMIKGSPESVQLWQEFNRARDHFNKTFDTDTTLIRLMETDTTAKQLKEWVMGANAANAKPQMAATVNRLKGILGPDHPAIRGVQQDYLFDLYQPLFESAGPNFDGVVRNIDNAFKNHSEVLDALDLRKSDMLPLRHLADIAAKHPPGKVVKLVNSIPVALARLSPWAHGISKAGLKVSFLGNVLKRLGGTHPAQQRRLLAELAGTMPDAPVIPRESSAAATLLFSNFEKMAAQDSDE
jgi:hypothetical protein